MNVFGVNPFTIHDSRIENDCPLFPVHCLL